MKDTVTSRFTARVPYPSLALPPDPLSVLTLLESTYRANLNSRTIRGFLPVVAVSIDRDIQTITIAHYEEDHRLTFAGKFGQLEQLKAQVRIRSLE